MDLGHALLHQPQIIDATALGRQSSAETGEGGGEGLKLLDIVAF